MDLIVAVVILASLVLFALAAARAIRQVRRERPRDWPAVRSKLLTALAANLLMLLGLAAYFLLSG